MIPGKIFFQSIEISEHFTKKYEVYLLMNGIFYDKIKPFQSKYLCLTANDSLEVELGLKNSYCDKENDRILSQLKLKQDKKIEQNKGTKILPSQYLKVLISQAFKLVIQSKTIDIKFQLNSKNGNEEIKINFSFEPVSSFNRKKLGATLISNKNAKNTSNFNFTQQRLNTVQRRQKNLESFGESSQVNSPKNQFPEKIDFLKGKNSHSRSPASSQGRGSIDREYEGRVGLSKTMENRRGYFRQKMNEQFVEVKVTDQTKKQQRKLNYIPKDVIIEDESSYNSNKFFSSNKKQISIQSNELTQEKYKVDTMKRVIDPIPHFNHATNIQMLSDIIENQTYTSRGNLIFQGSEQKATGEKNSEQIVPKNHQNPSNYQTQGNQRFFDSASDQDTLESLAYQREKILGELFGKLGARGKK